VVAAVLSPQRQSIHHAGAESGHGGRLEKGISRREGNNGVPQTQREGRRQHQNIKVTRVICNDYKRSGRGKMLGSIDFDSFSQSEKSAHQKPPKAAANEAEKPAFAFDRAKAVDFGHAEVLSRFVLPVLQQFSVITAILC
jgi:hypothetical protein